MGEIVKIDYAVVVEDKVHWFTSYIEATYFASDNNADLIENVEYENGDKVRRNLNTGESRTF